ncbi:MAG: ATP-dependent protease ATPase subunit HslU [Deltaproteobacteria bacterium]|nr:ATP-dependent protease ATPase subunit HslU [Deltaproteobacteria bacterium]
MNTTNITPREIVSELDRYIVGQGAAKRAVAIALRNRWRRQQVDLTLRDEITPKNIIMIGPTGVGKTEIARRLAKLAGAPFIKVEATKFTEVGYVGKDTESMVRELVDMAIKMVREEEDAKVRVRAREMAEEKLVDLLFPPTDPRSTVEGEHEAAREELRRQLRQGKLDERTVEIEQTPKMGPMPSIEVVAATNLEEMSQNLREMFSNMMPQGKKKSHHVRVPEALKILEEEEASRLVDAETVVRQAIERVEQNGIIFLDELDKIASPRGEHQQGPDVSREGVQRDLLPIVEGSTVTTKYGMVKTDHVLFIAAGAFHATKPSDLIPELQGRFPIRVELQSLGKDEFFRILTEPENSLTKQYIAMMATEGMAISFVDGALQEICAVAAEVNGQTEDIGARRLHTVMEKLFEAISFDAPDKRGQSARIDRNYVQQQLADIVRNRDLTRYIL